MITFTPKHIAITMDGNGRWGEARGLTRSEGHYAGTQAMEKTIDACIELNIETVTLYAFSSENWSRSKQEVGYLMQLPIRFFKSKLPEFMRRNIKIMVSGDMTKVPASTRNAIIKAVKETAGNSGMIVNFAFNYGGRDEIMQAVRAVMGEIKEGKLDVEMLDEMVFSQYLYTKELPDPELFIRTGGEKRLSNFLLWQAADAELYFTDAYFPDFNKDMLIEAIKVWQSKLPFEPTFENFG